MITKWKEIESPVVEEVQSFKIYLQVQLSGGFWDTLKEVNEKDFLSITVEWDKLCVEYLEKGFRVRMLGERIVKSSSYTEVVKK